MFGVLSFESENLKIMYSNICAEEWDVILSARGYMALLLKDVQEQVKVLWYGRRHVKIFINKVTMDQKFLLTLFMISNIPPTFLFNTNKCKKY